MAKPLESYFDDFTRRDWLETTDPEREIRIAVIGLGWFAQRHAIPAIKESDLCEPTVLVSGSSQKAKSVASREKIDRAITYEGFHTGVAKEEYDAVYIATPNSTHLEHTETAARLDKDVLCEKPMEISTGKANQMVEICEEEGVKLMIGYRMHTEPAARRARELIRDGFIGAPRQVQASMSQKLLELLPNTDQWRLDPEVSGGGAMMDIGLYPLNTTRFLLDEDPVSVQATTASVNEFFEDVDEHVAFQLLFPGKVTASCNASHNAYKESRLCVVGEQGRIKMEAAFFPWQKKEFSIERSGTESTLTYEQPNQLVEEFDYFADCILSNKDPYADGVHGAKDIEAVEAVYESARTGSRVTL